MANPTDYPQFSFRIDPSDKERIVELVEKVKDKANKRRKPGTKVVKKNDVLVKALEVGLAVLMKDIDSIL